MSQADKQAFIADFNKLYTEFANARTELLKMLKDTLPEPKNGDHELYLGVANFVDKDWWSENDIEGAANKTRRAGRSLIKHVINSPDMVRVTEAFFISSGYAELVNVYVVTAPLDAINWKHMKKYTETTLASWADVLATGIEAEDIHPTLMTLFKDVTVRFSEGKLEKDPLPRDTLNKIIYSNQSVVPDRLKEHIPKLNAYMVGPAPPSTETAKTPSVEDAL
jgi:hypothetical protein